MVSFYVSMGVPDKKWGEVGKAFIVKKKGTDLAEERVKEYCHSHLAKFKVPKSVIFVKELPKNDTGKVNRKALV